ncbi:MAG: hypothetical protein PWQ91_855 [Eubacteriales bacterium]|nr:hypothetical protein [Eubacteriales bacterium]MDN5363794.1 hypothetical protein [Eubacteriales bacterium]
MRIALQMEEKGREFYRRQEERYDKPEVKDIFHRLAGEEEEHIKIFSHLLGELEDDAGIAGEEEYLQTLADLFRLPELPAVDGPADALAIGIQMEKDAILFYSELYSKTDSEKVKEALSRLLEEEKKHLVELRESMEELS